jgi:hypothetical protein
MSLAVRVRKLVPLGIAFVVKSIAIGIPAHRDTDIQMRTLCITPEVQECA